MTSSAVVSSPEASSPSSRGSNNKKPRMHIGRRASADARSKWATPSAKPKPRASSSERPPAVAARKRSAPQVKPQLRANAQRAPDGSHARPATQESLGPPGGIEDRGLRSPASMPETGEASRHRDCLDDLADLVAPSSRPGSRGQKQDAAAKYGAPQLQDEPTPSPGDGAEKAAVQPPAVVFEGDGQVCTGLQWVLTEGWTVCRAIAMRGHARIGVAVL